MHGFVDTQSGGDGEHDHQRAQETALPSRRLGEFIETEHRFGYDPAHLPRKGAQGPRDPPQLQGLSLFRLTLADRGWTRNPSRSLYPSSSPRTRNRARPCLGIFVFFCICIWVCIWVGAGRDLDLHSPF